MCGKTSEIDQMDKIIFYNLSIVYCIDDCIWSWHHNMIALIALYSMLADNVIGQNEHNQIIKKSIPMKTVCK